MGISYSRQEVVRAGLLIGQNGQWVTERAQGFGKKCRRYGISVAGQGIGGFMTKKKTSKKWIPIVQSQKQRTAIVRKHLDALRNKPRAVILTRKAIDEIILTLRTTCRNSEHERAYLQWIITKLEKVDGTKKRRGK